MFLIGFLTLIFIGATHSQTTPPPQTPNFPTDVTGKPLEISTTPMVTTPDGDPILGLSQGTWHPQPTTNQLETTVPFPFPTDWVPTTNIDDGLVYCRLNSTEFIDTQQKINQLENCQVIQGSLFITGGREITNLKGLSKLQRITGSLVITYLTGVEDLADIKNLTQIDGDVLYLNQYAVFIAHNHRRVDSSVGLCYADKVNWTDFVRNGDVDVFDNRKGCSDCDSHCVGCYGPGAQNCQKCRNFLSGITCVDKCFSGSLLDEVAGECHEYLPTQPQSPFVAIINETTVIVSLSLQNSNGVPLKISLWRNQTLVKTWEFPTDVIYEYLDANLLPMTYYEYSWNLENSVGVSPISNSTIIETMKASLIPEAPRNFTVSNITSRHAHLSWLPADSNYRLIVGQSVDKNTYIVVLNITLDKNSHDYHLAGLLGEHFYRVSLWSRFPAEVEFETPSRLPCPPRLDLVTIDSTYMDIKWNSKKCFGAGRIIEYQLTVGYLLGDIIQTYNFTGNSSNFRMDVSMFGEGRILNIMIRGRTSSGWSNWAEINVTIPANHYTPTDYYSPPSDDESEKWYEPTKWSQVLVMIVVVAISTCTIGLLFYKFQIWIRDYVLVSRNKVRTIPYEKKAPGVKYVSIDRLSPLSPSDFDQA